MKFNEIWHIDTSVVRLLDGSKAYLHAVIDNYSRRILSWKVSSTFNTVATAEILLTASKGMADFRRLSCGRRCGSSRQTANSSRAITCLRCVPPTNWANRGPVQAAARELVHKTPECCDS